MFCHYFFGGKSLGLHLAHMYRQAQGRARQTFFIRRNFIHCFSSCQFLPLLISSFFFFSLLGRDSPFSISVCFYYYYYFFLFKKWCLFGSKQFSIRNICLDSASTFCVLHFFFFLLAPLALFMSHKQCIKVNEQCFVSVNSNRKFMFLLFSDFSKISGIQMSM